MEMLKLGIHLWAKQKTRRNNRLEYDKLSFVSEKDWARNPEPKQAALAAITANAFRYDYLTDTTQTRPRRVVVKKSAP